MANYNYQKYQRQTQLPNFGLVQQKKLFEAKVLVIGAGGLGCPALLYLAASGIGNIGIVDFDLIEESNLPRQILYLPSDISKNKALAASEKLSESFPDSQFIPYPFKLTPDNAVDLINSYDLVLDGTDTFTSRYLINDTCVKLNKPMVYGSVSRYEGQVAVFNLLDNQGQKFNYRDLFSEIINEASIKNCAEAGILGVLTGIIGSLQANEAIKIITGLGEPLANKILTYHSLHNVFYETSLVTTKSRSLATKSDLDINKLRESLNALDQQIVTLLGKRNELVLEIGKQKKILNQPVVQQTIWGKSHRKKNFGIGNFSIEQEICFGYF